MTNPRTSPICAPSKAALNLGSAGQPIACRTRTAGAGQPTPPRSRTLGTMRTMTFDPAPRAGGAATLRRRQVRLREPHAGARPPSAAQGRAPRVGVRIHRRGSRPTAHARPHWAGTSAPASAAGPTLPGAISADDGSWRARSAAWDAGRGLRIEAAVARPTRARGGPEHQGAARTSLPPGGTPGCLADGPASVGLNYSMASNGWLATHPDRLKRQEERRRFRLTMFTMKRPLRAQSTPSFRMKASTQCLPV